MTLYRSLQASPLCQLQLTKSTEQNSLPLGKQNSSTGQLGTLVVQFCIQSGQKEGFGVFTYILQASIYPEAPELLEPFTGKGTRWYRKLLIVCLKNQRIQWTQLDNAQGVRRWFS